MKILIATGVTALVIAAFATTASAGEKTARIGAAASVASFPQAAPRGLVAERTFPARLNAAELRRADRIAALVRVRRGDTLTTKLKVCVAPNGAVTSTSILRSSGLASFDKVVLDAAERWAYRSYSAPSTTRVCHNASIVYRTR